MDKALEKIAADLESSFAGEKHEFRGLVSVTIAPENIVAACKAMRDKHGFEMMASEFAVDYGPEASPRFHIVYELLSIGKNLRMELRTPLDGDKPSLETMTGVYPGANWYEREIWDMFGVRFEGHPDLRRLMMPADWEGHPLRKDYPLGYEEVQFTFNYDEIEKRKPRPKN